MSGAGVFVLGMHRSGTSAAARLVNLLGLPLCVEDDRLGATAGNARGHWESTSLIDFDEALLGALGGAWWCPPRLVERWWDDPALAARAVAGRARFTAVHPGSRWVWKDPRACITLPFWRRALVARTAAVVIGRDPVEVAASLTARNHFSPTRGLQLWERYTHHLLPALAGLPVTFTTYDDLMADPVGWSRRVAAFLDGQGFAVRVRPSAVQAFVAPGLRHHHPGDATDGAAPTPAQRDLADVVTGLAGDHGAFAVPDLPVETPATDRALDWLRTAHRLLDPGRAPFAAIDTGAPGAPTVPDRRTPPRPRAGVVIVGPDGPARRRTVARVHATVPPGTEVVLAADGDGGGDGRGPAAERTAGAAATRAATLVFVDAGVEPDDGWFAPLVAAAEEPSVGAAAPVLVPRAHPALRLYGLRVADAALNVAWIDEAAATGAGRNGDGVVAGAGEPVAVPLLAGRMLAIRRRVLDAVGGFDGGMGPGGAEDLDLCLRLWRRGWACLAVPRATATARFPAGRAGPGFVHNLVRLGTVHLGADGLAALVDCLAGTRALPAALAEAAAGDALARRQALARDARYDTAWLWGRFAFGPATASPERAATVSLRG